MTVAAASKGARRSSTTNVKPQPLKISTPFSFATPSIAIIDNRIAPYSLWLIPYRGLRIAWVIALLPLHVILCLIVALHLPVPPGIPASLHPPSKSHHWNLLQNIFYPVVKRLIWSFTDVGGAPELSDASARIVPNWTVWLLNSVYPGHDTVQVNVEEAQPSNQGALGLDVELIDSGTSVWYQGDASDPNGRVLPAPVPMFWFELEPGPDQACGRRADPDERVVLYFVGGGYVIGSPAEGNRCYSIAKRTGLRVAGANYRKATRPSLAFPAALQDAITAYKHLLDLGFQDIVLAGDSAGGGLAMTLLLYLCKTLTLSANPPDSLILPSSVLLYSPWVDLTLRSIKNINPRLADDLLSQGQASYAARAYLINTIDTYSDDPKSIYNLGARHPFVSPSLPSSMSTLESISKAYAHLPPLRMLIFSGGAEYFAPEIQALVFLLRKSCKEGLELSFVEEKNEVHAFPLMPTWVSPAADRALNHVTAFLLDKA